MAKKSITSNNKYADPKKNSWFITHAAQAPWLQDDKFGSFCNFEGKHRFPQIGVNIHLINPGQPSSLYHQEQAQENFFVLSGKCIAIIEENEYELEAGHFVHCPNGTKHVFVGAGEGPCAILMIGYRPVKKNILYPVSKAADVYGASVENETTSPSEAYGTRPMFNKSVKAVWPLY